MWFTGLSGSGKSTVANLIEKRLTAEGRHCYILDGDNVRHGLNKDLGFTEEARVENIRRVGEVARLMADAGLIVLVSFISPFRNERRLAREIAGDIAFQRSLCRYAARSLRSARPQGALCAGARAARSRTSPASTARSRRLSIADMVLHGATTTPEEMAERALPAAVLRRGRATRSR